MKNSCIRHPANGMVSIGQKWAVDLYQGEACSALIIGYFQLIHIGRLPKPFLIGSTEIEAGLMGGYKRRAIGRSIKRLVRSGLLTSHWLTDEESADHYLSETTFYCPSDKLLALFELHPLSLEDVL